VSPAVVALPRRPLAPHAAQYAFYQPNMEELPIREELATRGWHGHRIICSGSWTKNMADQSDENRAKTEVGQRKGQHIQRSYQTQGDP